MQHPASPPNTPAKHHRKLPPSSPISPVILPANPFNRHTPAGRARILRRDEGLFPNELDKWIQANTSLWPREDPRLPTTELMTAKVSCHVEMAYIPVCLDSVSCTRKLFTEVSRQLYLLI